MPASGPPALIRLYGTAADMAVPLAYRRVAAKLRAQGIDPGRLRERLGHATQARPDGPLLWFHAASVGESLSVLRLIARVGETHPGLSFLLTSGTATSARVLEGRLPPRCIHQFAPLDGRRPMRRFLAHWAPSAAIFVESELWPNMLRTSHAAGIPMALLNARISDTSARNWKRFPQAARHLMGLFRLIHTQDARTTRHLHDLGLGHAVTGQNLKSVCGPPPFDAAELDSLRAALDGRPCWVAGSTHPGEEEVMLAAQASLLKDFPDLLLVLVPRHPERGDAIEALIARAGLAVARRSRATALGPDVQVYLADTMGETGLWYRLAPVTCLGGSFTPVGGHNPFEPAYAGSAVLHGPLYANFTRAYADFATAGGAVEVPGAADLTRELAALLGNSEQLEQRRAEARAFAAAQDDMLEALTATMSHRLDLGHGAKGT